MNKKIQIATLSVFVAAFAFSEGGDGGIDQETRERYTLYQSDSYLFSADYSDLIPIVLKTYEFRTYSLQLANIESQLTGDLYQVLDVRANPVNLQDKKWSKDELDAITKECLSAEEKK